MWAAFFHMQYSYFIFGLTIIALVSFADDVQPLSIWVRMLAQAGTLVLLIKDLGLFDSSFIIYTPMLLVFCIGVINAFNFLDGINGITGCYCLAVLAPLAYLNSTIHFVDDNLIFVVAISVAIFLFFNFRSRAKCFAGDVGSVSIGFLVIFLVGKLIVATQNPVYLLLVSVCGADIGLTIVHRLILHENIFVPHRKHAFQIMVNELKMRHTVVSLIYMTVQMIISFGLIFINHNLVQWIYFGGIILILICCYVLFMRKYYYLHEKYLLAQEQ